MRIASLVPSATETLFALGLGDSVVAVTHECDFPDEAATRPHVTRSVIPPGLSAGEIDAAVRDRIDRGEALYRLHDDRLAELRPDLIVTQALCSVCAVSVDDVRTLAESLPSQPQVVSLDPSTLGEVLADVRRLGEATGAEAAAERLLSDAADRLDAVEGVVGGEPRPRVAALEWLDPPFIGGHWVPQMIELAGGEDALGLTGERSDTVTWEILTGAGADVAVVMPCGYDLDGSVRQAAEHPDRLAGLGATRVVAVDSSAYFSRPGPRLVDGVELLAHVLHPERAPAPPAGRLAEVVLAPSPRTGGPGRTTSAVQT